MKAVLSDEQFHSISRALADPRRFAILQQVATAPCMACAVLNVHDVISPATISHHVKELQEAGLIEVQREGRGANLFLNRGVYEEYLARLGKLLSG